MRDSLARISLTPVYHDGQGTFTRMPKRANPRSVCYIGWIRGKQHEGTVNGSVLSQIVHIVLVIFIARAAYAIFFFLRFPLLSRQLFRSSNLSESNFVSFCLHVHLVC